VPLKVRAFIDHLVNAFGDAPPWDRAPPAPPVKRDRKPRAPQR
jgi:hypothetical protein